MSSTSLLEMKHVKKTFGSLEVLKDISIEVNEGEVDRKSTRLNSSH